MSHTSAGHKGQDAQGNISAPDDGPRQARQSTLAAGQDGRLVIAKAASNQGGVPTNSAQINAGINNQGRYMANRKRRQTEMGPEYEPPNNKPAVPDNAGESEERQYKKHLRCWTPVLTGCFDQPIESRAVSFITTEHLHEAMGTTDQDKWLLNQPSRQGAGFVLKLEKWDLTDSGVTDDITSVYDLPSD